MLVIKKICDYTIPIFGNKRVLPYAKLLVSDGITEKLRPIIDDVCVWRAPGMGRW